jgi:putative heme-binding domain-containing protein
MTRYAAAFFLVAALAAAPIQLRSQDAAPDHPDQYAAADVAAGGVLYNRLCVNCHGVGGTGVGGIDLHRGVLPRARTDEALRTVISTGFPQAGMPPFRLEPQELQALVAFVRAGFDAGDAAPVKLGDAARGRELFQGKGQCLSCHRVNQDGSFAGPDLTDIGRTRQPASIRGALLTPTAFMRPINKPVRAVTKDGAVITGRRLNEDTYTDQIITAEGRLISLVKPGLKEWSVGSTSPMPSYKDALTPDELSDLLAYLVTLKG